MGDCVAVGLNSDLRSWPGGGRMDARLDPRILGARGELKADSAEAENDGQEEQEELKSLRWVFAHR